MDWFKQLAEIESLGKTFGFFYRSKKNLTENHNTIKNAALEQSHAHLCVVWFSLVVSCLCLVICLDRGGKFLQNDVILLFI